MCTSPMLDSQSQSGIVLLGQRNHPMFHYVRSSNKNPVHHNRQPDPFQTKDISLHQSETPIKHTSDSNVVNQKGILENRSSRLELRDDNGLNQASITHKRTTQDKPQQRFITVPFFQCSSLIQSTSCTYPLRCF